MEMIPKILEKLENKKNTDFRRIFQSWDNNKKKLESKYKNINQQKKILFGIQYSLVFLSSQDNPWKLLLVNKDFNNCLENKIFKLYLTRDFEANQLSKNRLKIWQAMLKTNLLDHDYEQMIKDVESQKNNHSQEKIEEIIILDVNRSLHIHSKLIKSDLLTRILKVFAFYNLNISYCQGMNYIAGYLYLLVKNEKDAYNLFHMIMNKYFSDLFTDSFSKLKTMFYQFDRCLSIFLPEISDHFKQERIDPQYYSTSWFITVFSCVTQYAMESYVLNIFWDFFIVEGWKGMFKCALWLLKTFQSQLLKMQFDELLHFIGDLIKNDIFVLNEDELRKNNSIVKVDNIKAEINQFHITNSLLTSLDKEYNYFILNVNEVIKEMIKSK